MAWSDLSQEDKYELIRDYVRSGFHRLEDIIEDYNNNIPNYSEEYNSSVRSNGTHDPLQDVIDEYYG